MPSESGPYRPFAKKEQDAAVKKALQAIKEERFNDIPDEETFRLARIQYIRERMTSQGGAGRPGDTLEKLYGELEKKWKAAQEAKKSKKLEAGKLVPDQPKQRPDIMDEKTFDSIFGDLSSTKEKEQEEQERPLPITENVPLIPYEEEEPSKQEESKEKELIKDEVVSVKISLPIGNNKDKEFIIMGRVVKPSSQTGEESTIIKYLGGLSEEDKESATQNGFIRRGFMKVDNHLITPLRSGYGEGRFIEQELGVHPFDRLEVVGQEGYFRAIGVGKNGSTEKPTVIVISEKALLRGPQLEDELEVPLTDVSKIKK